MHEPNSHGSKEGATASYSAHKANLCMIITTTPPLQDTSTPTVEAHTSTKRFGVGNANKTTFAVWSALVFECDAGQHSSSILELDNISLQEPFSVPRP